VKFKGKWNIFREKGNGKKRMGLDNHGKKDSVILERM
jgi:hypothetical protein